jgi:predicted transcriptional regulator
MKNASETQAKLSQDLKKAREEARLSQQQLADLASISNRPIYIFETGKGSIRLDTYLRLLDVLGLELHIRPRPPREQRP